MKAINWEVWTAFFIARGCIFNGGRNRARARIRKGFSCICCCNMRLATAVGALCSYIAPDVRSDILEVNAYLNGVDVPLILAASTLFVKGSIISKEGPMVHTSACIANLLGQDWAWLRCFKNAQDRRDLVICGVVTGAAAAFLAPVGGVLLALEEAASWYAFASCLFYSSLVIVWLLPQARSGVSNERLTPFPKDHNEKCPTIGESGNHKIFQCQAICYNDLTSLFLNDNDDAIRNLFSAHATGVFETSSLFMFFMTIYGVAIFVRGIMRITVSLCVILLGLASDLLLLPLMMLVVFISKTIANILNKAQPELNMKHLMATYVISGLLIKFLGVEKVESIVYALQGTTHNGFPVINEVPFTDAPELCGLVLRSHLLVLLKAKCFSKERVHSGINVLKKVSPFYFAKRGSRKELKLEDITMRRK
ncbi:hypothetical protein Cgig2_033490 [Carnegiea gigantea]|uniref:Uncharacterized protein n=1 Tax=Carnegiea gigantea TaxID=171969 RepID=A0A9Q1GPA6_9CARY|nr:hypothetical protein Cgig2_033490 [Carnegiea gigantea]